MGSEPVEQVGADVFVGGLALGVKLYGAVGFAGVVVQGEVFDDGFGAGGDADKDIGAGGEGSAGCLGGLEGDVVADAAVGAKVLEVVAGEGAADGLVVLAHDPVFAVDVEGVDDVALAGIDAGSTSFAGSAEEGSFAIEFTPAAERGFDDDQVLVGDPELGLGRDDGAVLDFGSFVLVQAELGVADAFFGVDVAGMGFDVGGEELLGALVLPGGESLAGGVNLGRIDLLGCGGRDERGQHDGRYPECRTVALVQVFYLRLPCRMVCPLTNVPSTAIAASRAIQKRSGLRSS